MNLEIADNYEFGAKVAKLINKDNKCKSLKYYYDDFLEEYCVYYDGKHAGAIYHYHFRDEIDGEKIDEYVSRH